MTRPPLALVTGAAHRLGRVFAISLAQKGYSILLHYHTSKQKAEKTASEIEALGTSVYLNCTDLTSESHINKLFINIENKYPTLLNDLQVLVNSAAIMPKKDLRTLSASNWDEVMQLNLRAPFLLAQKAVKLMGRGGLIINITDVGANKYWSQYAAYVVSKSALETLTKLMAKEYAPIIRVNAIAPGFVLPSTDHSFKGWKQLIDRLPLEHAVSTDNIASALEFLLNNDSITGQTITVDGGYSLT
jgi:NAD(P)-dependent dehydrogenase (short-subunit alcohol dehydrogenase family)